MHTETPRSADLSSGRCNTGAEIHTPTGAWLWRDIMQHMNNEF
jgi:hypothetical protein